MSLNKFLEGKKIQEVRGSGKFRSVLKNLKKHSFNGYIEVEIPDEYDGFVIIKDGIPRTTYLKTPLGESKGLEALESIQAVDKKPDLKIRVYKNLDIDKLLTKLEGKKLVGREVKSDVEEDHQRRSSGYIDESLELISESHKTGNLDQEFPEKFSFDNFVVGPNNRFAYTAATAVAEAPQESYNPLFIKGEKGLGKTHLLKAIGRYLSQNAPKRYVKYIVTSKFISDYEKYSKKDQMNKFKERNLDIDTLILDDIQLLAEKEEVQDEIFYLFNKIQGNGGQVIVSSDRPPEKIDEIEDRLVSSFKSGLVVDILPPTYQSRMEIIKKKAEQYSTDMPSEVLEYIAKNIKKDVRYMEGALNRVSAYSELLDEEVTLSGIKKALDQFIDEEAESGRLKLDVRNGRSYLIEEERAEKGFELFEKIDQDNKFIVSRMNPNRIIGEFDLDEAEIKWLTDKKSDIFETIPPNLERLSWILEQTIKEDSVILLDGLEYLISNVNFEASLKFIRHMVDIVSETDSIFLVIVSPKALETKQISVLEREMETISYIS